MIKGHRCRIFIQKTSQESEIAIVPPPTPTHKIIPTDQVQTYDEIPAQVRPRYPLVNWTCVRLGDNPNRPTTDEITQEQLQLNIFNDNNTNGQFTIGQQMILKVWQETLFNQTEMISHQDQV